MPGSPGTRLGPDVPGRASRSARRIAVASTAPGTRVWLRVCHGEYGYPCDS